LAALRLTFALGVTKVKFTEPGVVVGETPDKRQPGQHSGVSCSSISSPVKRSLPAFDQLGSRSGPSVDTTMLVNVMVEIRDVQADWPWKGGSEADLERSSALGPR